MKRGFSIKVIEQNERIKERDFNFKVLAITQDFFKQVPTNYSCNTIEDARNALTSNEGGENLKFTHKAQRILDQKVLEPYCINNQTSLLFPRSKDDLVSVQQVI